MEKMKKTSNNELNYPGHIDCRNRTVDDRFEWESKFSVKLRALGILTRFARQSKDRSNLNSNYLER